MEYHKGIMKLSLAESLRKLMQKQLFEKITIKKICDETGVIRATFYNYFEDKYDCLNWIVYHDLFESTNEYNLVGDVDGAITEALRQIMEHKSFYRTAFDITGQNSFEDMVRDNFTALVAEYLSKFRKPGYLDMYDNELLARYYGDTLTFILRIFVFEIGGSKSIDETKKMIIDLMTHSFFDFVQQDSSK